MFGTNFTYDALVTQRAADTIEEIGFERVYDAIEDGLRVHNGMTEEVFGFFAEVRNESVPGEFRYDTYGGNRILKMEKVDQIGMVDAQKTNAGQTVGFPIDRKQAAVQWTYDYLEIATGEELTRDFNAVREGDTIEIRNELLESIFNPANRIEVERFHNHVQVNVKALLNADGMEIPIGPRGATFNGGSHNHYLVSATLTAAALRDAINTVKEHYLSGKVYLFINKANEDAVRGLVGFMPYLQQNVIPGTANDRVDGVEEDMPLDDKSIGEFEGAEIWLKPWMPANYYFPMIVSPRIRKIARVRRRRGGLYIATQERAFPLRADFMQHEYGVGVLERTAGAILYVGAGGVYVPPLF